MLLPFPLKAFVSLHVEGGVAALVFRGDYARVDSVNGDDAAADGAQDGFHGFDVVVLDVGHFDAVVGVDEEADSS